MLWAFFKCHNYPSWSHGALNNVMNKHSPYADQINNGTFDSRTDLLENFHMFFRFFQICFLKSHKYYTYPTTTVRQRTAELPVRCTISHMFSNDHWSSTEFLSKKLLVSKPIFSMQYQFIYTWLYCWLY